MKRFLIVFFMLFSTLAHGQTQCSAPPQSPLFFWGSPNIQIDDRAGHVGQFVIEGFAFWGWGPLPQRGWCGQMVNSLSQLTVDIKTVGMNGIDVNPNGAGNMPPDGAYDVHLFAMPGTPSAIPPIPDAVEVIVSLQGSTPAVPHDAGYDLYRKMPYNVIVRNGVIMPSTVIGWPTPCISFTSTDSDGVTPNTVVQEFPSATGKWVGVDVTKMIGENSNFGYWRAIISGGTASVWLSPSNVSPGNAYFKTLATNQTGSTGSIPVRTTSQGTGQPALIYIWTDNYVPASGGAGVVVKLVLDQECVSEQTD